MPDIGYNDNVHVGGRTFHIQTASNTSKGVARCEVFEEGRVITTQSVEFERRKLTDEALLEERIRGIVSSLHKDTLNEIRIMFHIADRVKKLRNAPSHVKLGLIFLRNNLLSDAIEQFEAALAIEPHSTEALNSLAMAFIAQGRNQKAIDLLKQAIHTGKGYADIHQNLGLAYLNESQYVQSLKHYQEALKINPHYYEAQYNLAIAYLESVLADKSESKLPPPSIRMQRAQQQLNQLSNSQAESFGSIHTKVKKALEKSDLKSAIDLLKKNREKVFPKDILSLIGMDFHLKFMYGGKGLEAGTIEKFEEKLLRSVKSNPEYADLWNNLGIVHLIQCRNLFLQALEEFDKALEINPSFQKALKNKKLVENDGKEFLILLRAILK